jgi:hypothetical protein
LFDNRAVLGEDQDKGHMHNTKWEGNCYSHLGLFILSWQTEDLLAGPADKILKTSVKIDKETNLVTARHSKNKTQH